MKLTCDCGGELRGQCPQLRKALATIVRLEAKLRKAKRPGRVLFWNGLDGEHACLCKEGPTHNVCDTGCRRRVEVREAGGK